MSTKIIKGGEKRCLYLIDKRGIIKFQILRWRNLRVKT
jgi:hypothetical protein